MKIVGDYLKKHREIKNISLEQAALVTKISAGTLRAIEEANLKKLPSKSYLRGFVFSYGQFLDVDKNELEKLFAEEMGSTNPKVHQEIIQKQTWQTIPLINKIKINAKTFIVAGLVGLLFLAITAQSIIKKYQNEKVITPNVAIVETKKILHPEPIAKPIEKKAIEETKAKDEAIPAVKTATQITQDTIYQDSKEFKELIIQAKDDTTVTIKIGDKEKRNIKLLSGDFHTIKAKSKLIFQAPDPKSIKLIYNGVLQTKFENNDNPITVTY